MAVRALILRFVGHRIGLAAITLLAVSALIFVFTSVLPGDIGERVLGRESTEQQRQIFRERLNLDRPVYERYAIWLATFPIRYNLTQTFWRVARNYDLDPARDQVYEDFEDIVRAQDKPVVESQRPWLLPPFWTRLEMPLRPADLPLIEYQRWLEELDIMLTV